MPRKEILLYGSLLGSGIQSNSPSHFKLINHISNATWGDPFNCKDWTKGYSTVLIDAFQIVQTKLHTVQDILQIVNKLVISCMVACTYNYVCMHVWMCVCLY